MTQRVMGRHGNIRGAATITMVIVPFLVWMGYGLGRDDWRGGTIVASMIALGLLAVQAVTLIADKLASGLLALGIEAILPTACLVWAFSDGWAWLWTVGWMLAAVFLWQVVIVEIRIRAGASLYQQAEALLADALVVLKALRFARGVNVAGAWATLASLHLGAPRQVWIPLVVLWTTAFLVTGVCTLVLHIKLRGRGVPLV